MLHKLEALLAVADETTSLIITGNGVWCSRKRSDRHRLRRPYARAAARAMLENTEAERPRHR